MEIPPANNTAPVTVVKSKEKTLAAMKQPASSKVRSTRSSRLREEQHKAALANAQPIPRPPSASGNKLPSTHNASSASSGNSTPATRAENASATVPHLNLSSAGQKGKRVPHDIVLGDSNPNPTAVGGTVDIKPSPATTDPLPAFSNSVSVTSIPSSAVSPRPVPPSSSVTNPQQLSSTSPPATPKIVPTAGNISAGGGVSLLSMPPQSPHLGASTRTSPSTSVSSSSQQSTSISHHSYLSTPSTKRSQKKSKSVTRAGTGSATSTSGSHSNPSSTSKLSAAERSVLEDIQIISDWLQTIQQSKRSHLLQFRSTIQRMKKTIFLPAQVKRSRAQQQRDDDVLHPQHQSSIVPTHTSLPLAGDGNNKSRNHGQHLSPSQRKISSLSTTYLNVHLDLRNPADQGSPAHDSAELLHHDPIPHHDGNESDMEGGELGFDLDSGDFDSKLSTFLRRTTKRDEEVLRNGGMAPHAPSNVVFENGKWIPRHESTLHHAGSLPGLSARSQGSDADRNYEISRNTDADHSDFAFGSDDDALDEIPDFSQSGVDRDRDPSSSSPSSIRGQAHTRRGSGGGGSSTSAAVRMRSGSTSQSFSTSTGGKRSGRSAHRDPREGASSVSLAGRHSASAGATSPGFGDDYSEDGNNGFEPSLSGMRSDSPSHARISMSHSQSVFSREEREMMLFGPEAEEEDVESALLYVEDAEESMNANTHLKPRAASRPRASSTNSTPVVQAAQVKHLTTHSSAAAALTTIGPSALPSSASAHASSTSQQAQSTKDKSIEEEFDSLDAIPDFDDAPPPTVASAPVAVVAAAAAAPGTSSPNAAGSKVNLAPFPFAPAGPNTSPTHNKSMSMGSFFSPTLAVAAANANDPRSSGSTPGGTQNQPAKGGPTLITMHSWAAMGRPASLDASMTGSLINPTALAALSAANRSSSGSNSMIQLPPAPTDPSTDTELFKKPSGKNDEFPDELDFEDDEDDGDEEVSKPLNESAKSTGSVVQKSGNASIIPTAHSNSHKPSKMQTFATLPAAMKFASQQQSSPSVSQSAVAPALSDEDLNDFNDAEVSVNSSSRSKLLPSPLITSPSSTSRNQAWSEPDSAKSTTSASAPSNSFKGSSGSGKSFNQRTLAKKKAEEEFPSDLDDLSDADFSDDDRSTTPGATATLGPAARSLNEFQISPELLSSFQSSERQHAGIFEGRLCRMGSALPIGKQGAPSKLGEFVQSALAGDSLTPALRNEYVSRKFDIQFLLTCSNAFTSQTATGASSSSAASSHHNHSHHHTQLHSSSSSSSSSSTANSRSSSRPPASHGGSGGNNSSRKSPSVSSPSHRSTLSAVQLPSDYTPKSNSNLKPTSPSTSHHRFKSSPSNSSAR